MPVVARGPHQGRAALLRVTVSSGGLRLLHHLHLPQQPDRLHAVQQKPSTSFLEPVQQLTQKQVELVQLRYYNSEVHRAASVLPEFACKTVNDVN